jgi:hypothetical protein
MKIIKARADATLSVKDETRETLSSTFICDGDLKWFEELKNKIEDYYG